MSQTRFKEVPKAKEIEVFAVARRYSEDPVEMKVNLSVGAYRDEEENPWVFPIVNKVEELMAADRTLNHEYLPVAGLPLFRELAVQLSLGSNSPALTQNRAFGIQALSGTGALRIGAEFLKRFGGVDSVLCSKPTWANHNTIFKDCGFANIGSYRYWDEANRCLDLEGMLEDLRQSPDGAVVLLHGCCHNPTGVDPDMDQWKEIAATIRDKGHFPFFDCAYLGFGTGDVDEDATVLRYFVDEGFEMLIAQSFAKNFGLYNERAGCLTVVLAESAVTEGNEVVNNVQSQIEIIVRPMWSNPPNHGARIVATVLGNEAFAAEWRENVKTIATRILLVRRLLNEKLVQLGTPGKWDHVVQQKGMFTYTGLNPYQCRVLTEKYHIYLLSSGRINMAGLTTKNVDYVAKAIHDVCTMPEKE